MTRIWVISPFDKRDSEWFETAWTYDQQNNTIAIGWAKIGDPRLFIREESNEELIRVLNQYYPPKKGKKNNNPNNAGIIRRFYQTITKGDVIIARKGLNKIIGVGVVFEKNNQGFNLSPGTLRELTSFENVVNTKKLDL